MKTLKLDGVVDLYVESSGTYFNDTLTYHYKSGGSRGLFNCECIAIKK